ncbi:M15 family metallopeptidase [Thermolongibacillus altinsuensis]|uniref:M15 family metallopeptidase n=1 Tax=Thermolongibacillus altinsuensis TaxID=575256 RepID=UPI00242A3200|nr:M15 family metallopeptidase [Thermolongibacillus altinsuensis]GMB08719.1 hypothetical protein B1no1_14290 [Thermolongibacillus altinsuensis]
MLLPIPYEKSWERYWGGCKGSIKVTKDAIPQETDNATFFDATNISVQAMQNRQILAHALQSVGFVNYFTEWWHWSYGDRYWAVMTNADHALYHPVSEQELLNLLQKA